MVKVVVLVVMAALAYAGPQEVEPPVVDVPSVRWTPEVAAQLQDAYADTGYAGACVAAAPVKFGAFVETYANRTYWLALRVDPFTKDEESFCHGPDHRGVLVFYHGGEMVRPEDGCTVRHIDQGKILWCVAVYQLEQALNSRLDLGFIGVVGRLELDEELRYAIPWGPVVFRPSAWALCHWRGACD